MWGSGKKKKSAGSASEAGGNDVALRTAMFNKYVNPEEDPFSMDMEGIGALCDDIDLDPSADIRALVMMWKLGAAAKPGEISSSEWNKGCESLNLSSVNDLKKLLPALDTGFLDPSEFRKFFKFVFQFSREGTNKTIEKDMVVALLQIVLAGRNNLHLNSFCEFLESSGDENNRISLDSWTSFLDFSMNTSESTEEYDMDEGAWPVLIDEYVEWKQKKGKKK